MVRIVNFKRPSFIGFEIRPQAAVVNCPYAFRVIRLDGVGELEIPGSPVVEIDNVPVRFHHLAFC